MISFQVIITLQLALFLSTSNKMRLLKKEPLFTAIPRAEQLLSSSCLPGTVGKTKGEAVAGLRSLQDVICLVQANTEIY